MSKNVIDMYDASEKTNIEKVLSSYNKLFAYYDNVNLITLEDYIEEEVNF